MTALPALAYPGFCDGLDLSAVQIERWRATGRRFCAGIFDHPDDQ